MVAWGNVPDVPASFVTIVHMCMKVSAPAGTGV